MFAEGRLLRRAGATGALVIVASAGTLVAALPSSAATGHGHLVEQGQDQTVTVGADVLTVPSGGTITVGGVPVQVQPGINRYFSIAPPPGSTAVTDEGATSYALPPGASGESFSFDDATPGSLTIPSIAYDGPEASSPPAALPAPLNQAPCTLLASKPSLASLYGFVQGVGGVTQTADTSEQCPDTAKTVLRVKLQSTVTGPSKAYLTRGSGQKTGTGAFTRTVRTVCAVTNQNWRTKVSGVVVDTNLGYGATFNVSNTPPNPLINCPDPGYKDVDEVLYDLGLGGGYGPNPPDSTPSLLGIVGGL